MKNIKQIGKARKEYYCSCCGKLISVGDSYWRGTPFRQESIIRCQNCGIQPYEVSSSEYVRQIGVLIDKWQDDYGIDISEIVSVLEEISEELSGKYDNLPEGLQSSEVGELLEERMSNIEEVVAQLENIEESEGSVSHAIEEILGSLEY